MWRTETVSTLCSSKERGKAAEQVTESQLYLAAKCCCSRRASLKEASSGGLEFCGYKAIG